MRRGKDKFSDVHLDSGHNNVHSASLSFTQSPFISFRFRVSCDPCCLVSQSRQCLPLCVYLCMLLLLQLALGRISFLCCVCPCFSLPPTATQLVHPSSSLPVFYWIKGTQSERTTRKFVHVWSHQEAAASKWLRTSTEGATNTARTQVAIKERRKSQPATADDGCACFDCGHGDRCSSCSWATLPLLAIPHSQAGTSNSSEHKVPWDASNASTDCWCALGTSMANLASLSSRGETNADKDANALAIEGRLCLCQWMPSANELKCKMKTTSDKWIKGQERETHFKYNLPLMKQWQWQLAKVKTGHEYKIN